MRLVQTTEGVEDLMERVFFYANSVTACKQMGSSEFTCNSSCIIN